MRKPFLVLLFFLCSLSFFETEAQNNPSNKPNILVIIADDMSMNAGTYGDYTINTPGIDSIAKIGCLFEKAYCTSSSCSPSRASILTSRYPHQLGEGGNLWGTLPSIYPNYTQILKQNGYFVGQSGKGWGPGDFKAGGYSENPAGTTYKDFDDFLTKKPQENPFCFWIGSHDPHRPYVPELKDSVEFNLAALKIPDWLPINDVIKNDFLDYYAEVKRFDDTVKDAIDLLKKTGEYENTLIIITSDNGMPFPRVKANNYEESINIPLVIHWKDYFLKGRRYKELVSLIDLAPTILDVAGIAIPADMQGNSLVPLLTNNLKDKEKYEVVFTERERHANAREGNIGYPIRSVRTSKYLYIQNLDSERWPAGDPNYAGAIGPYGDIDNGPTKQFLVDNRNNLKFQKELAWSLEKRPEEELYDLEKDPNQFNNLFKQKEYLTLKKQLSTILNDWRKNTQDPLLSSSQDVFDTYPYYGKKKPN